MTLDTVGLIVFGIWALWHIVQFIREPKAWQGDFIEKKRHPESDWMDDDPRWWGIR